jgi:gamma-glutamyl-gamma-aminobutyrate hydrolase PuuD
MPADPRRPLIGVSMYRQITSWWSWERDAALVPGTYLDVLEAVGGQPVLIPPSNEAAPPGGYAAALASLDGLLLIGGGDVDAARYGQPNDPRNGGTSDRRDQLELELLAGALAAELPVLAVCRGMQLLNVYLGGDLVQQLPDVVGSDHHQPRPGSFGPIRVVTEEGSRVRQLFGEGTDVLCSHHQAVASLGGGLEVTARSEDGVIEAIELPGRRFVVGVQWHPEETGDTRLFGALVAEARQPSGPTGSTRPLAAVEGAGTLGGSEWPGGKERS